MTQCNTAKAGDSIQTYVVNEAVYGGNPNDWDLQVYDVTQGGSQSACTVNGHYDSGIGTPYLAAFILEREYTGGFPPYCTLPKFGSIAYTATMYTGGTYGPYTNGWYNLFVMQNSGYTNINTGAVNSANTFTSTWQTSSGT